MNDNEIIERIKYLMHELHYKQVEFAQKIDIDTSDLREQLLKEKNEMTLKN